MLLIQKKINASVNLIFKMFGLNILKQEAMLRLALKEAGLNHKKLNIKIDHINGVNIVNGIKLPIIYPASFFDNVRELQNTNKTIMYYFNGDMSPAGGRVNMLRPFLDKKSKIIQSDYGRSMFTKNKFNHIYYSELSSSCFGLCPHQKDFIGNDNTMWTYRFIECCMVRTIPVLFKETPLGNKFIDGFHFLWDEEVLNGDASYDKDKADQNFALCVDRFSLSQQIINRISKSLLHQVY